jgi:hypothetical protein
MASSAWRKRSGSLVVLAAVDVDHRGAGSLAERGRFAELLRRQRQVRGLFGGQLGPDGGDGNDQRDHGRTFP